MRSRTSCSWPAARSSSQRSAVRRSCQTSARCSGSPLAGSQATTVSRWLAIPIPSSCAAVDAGGGDRLGGDPPRHRPDLGGVVLDPARPREVLLELRVGAAGDPALARRRRGRWSRSFPGRSRGSRRPVARRRTGRRGRSSAAPRASAAGVFVAGPQAAQGEPVEKGDDRARVAPGSGTWSISRAGRGESFVGFEAAQRRLLQSRVPGRAQVQLDLGQALDPVVDSRTTRSISDRDLLDARGPRCAVGSDRLEPCDLLADEEQQALADQVDLARRSGR